MIRSLTLLGATGSIGASTLDLVRRNRNAWRIEALTAQCSAAELAALAREFGAKLAVVGDEACLPELRAALAGSGIEAAGGRAALVEAAARPVDMTVAAIVGCAGLAPVMAAIERGGTIALANKEALVSAGEMMMQAVVKHGATLLPTDSEHNAIFQCLPPSVPGGPAPGVSRILLTASGGPFLRTRREDLATVTPEQAVAHPNWRMGPKISVDSATLMNKGLELIEACHLFSVEPDRVSVIIHPQSIVHSLVEFEDGSVLAQMSHPDMRVPIAHALGWPDRIASGVASLDLVRVGRLSFEMPDLERFPCLRLAEQAARAGGTAPAVVNAANEVAVAAFLDRRLNFGGIAGVIESVLQQHQTRPVRDLDDALAADAWARERAVAALGSRQAAGA